MNKENIVIPSKILKKISEIELFSSSMRKLTLSEELENNEKEFILTIALFFLQEYSKDKRKRQYREFAYYIILKYSIIHNDFKPLYDISVVLGFYPISNFILQKNLLQTDKFQDFIIEQELKDFEYNNYVETYEQHMSREDILKNILQNNNISYIAPTSYGKSGIIIEIIKQNYIWKNIWIIVPTKSLLAQVHRDIQKERFNTKILTYDRMLDENTKNFIAIFTQERALRLLTKEYISFDILFIDEAHNILKNDSRNLLLARLLSLNSYKNKNAINIFLSPYMENSNNFLINKNENMTEKRVNFGMKELEIYEYTSNNDIYKYNRFLFPNNKEWYFIGNIPDFRIYIRENSWNKNFIYHGTPYKVQEIARDFYWIWKIIEPSEKLKNLINFLKNEVDEKFYVVKLLEKWILYIHWWLPDIIKEYLEYSFKTIEEIKYLVANSVILEWINLPIDTIFILESHWLLQNNKLINLVGRVNRLNQIFDKENWNLKKLLPKIHFVTSKFQRENQNFQNLIQSLSKQIINDKIENPLLPNFDIRKIKKDEKKYKEIDVLRKNEQILYQNDINEKFLELKKYIIENSINIFYKQLDLDKVIKNIERRLSEGNLNNLSIIDKIYKIFIIDNLEYTTNKTLKGFTNQKFRWFLDWLVSNFSKTSLKKSILDTYIYLKEKQNKWESLYINNQYFEPKENKKFSEEELKNLAIIQVKANSDFISFTLNKFITFLKDYNLITEQEYNEIYYWKIDEKYIKFIDSWLSKWILQKIIKDNQINNLWIDEFWNIIWNTDFKAYKDTLSDFEQFQINKIITIKNNP